MTHKCSSNLNKFRLIAGSLLTVLLVSCTGLATDQALYPVVWTTEFSMAELLDQTPTLSDQSDLNHLLDEPWYASIEVNTAESSATQNIQSCSDYFRVKPMLSGTAKEHEQNAFLELKVMCEATRVLSDASAANKTHLIPQIIGPEAPSILPESFALITSQNALENLQAAPDITTWSDINSILKVHKFSAHKTTYLSEAGEQTLKVIGYGDFDGDDWQDALLTLEDTVKGGSYYNLRLFIVSAREGDSVQSKRVL